ncbi:MAG: hypothetical protein HOV81_26640 [Kofleriaceae bacterium]|nr:hypothetical protein [Kofleriaceae bacterium]
MKLLALAFVSAALLAACDSPTGSTCPPTDPPTYASFGQAFFSKYCTDCHSANSPNRHDAPGDQNFDTEDDIRRHAADIDSEAAAGPDATNTSMPEKSVNVMTLPTLEERKLLGQYLACLQAQ